MRILWQLTATALLVAIGIGGMTSARAADREARAEVMGRLKIREELSAALAKGRLTRMDQFRILLHAKEVLTADDLHGLEQTLDRIARQQAASRAAKSAERSEIPVRQNQDQLAQKVSGSGDPERRGNPLRESPDDREPGIVTPSRYDEPQAVEMPVISDPPPNRVKALSDNPMMEEVPAGIGKPTIQPDSDDPEDCGCDAEECHSCFRWVNLDFFSSVDAFKGPIDIGDANGNFGLRFGVNAAVPILPRLGVGLQAGTAGVLSNLKGSPYPEPNATIRNQIFTTVGMFQRINREEGTFTWGFAYDWLFDNYYDNFTFGQWRVKAAWEFNPCNEVGIAAALPEHGSSGAIPTFFGTTEELHFKPIAQGYLYWKHTWCNDASLAGRLGLAERPGEFLFGLESRVPLTRSFGLTSNCTYIMPNASGGAIGQTQEIWNVSVGIEFVPGGFGQGRSARFQPFLPVADNGSMAVRELGQ